MRQASQALTKQRLNGLLGALDARERELRELALIEAARARAAEGGYGLCADYGEPIPFDRLQANPTALRCAACQGRREKLHAVAS